MLSNSYDYSTRAGVRPPIKVLAPDGLVVGLTLDDGTLFESLLEEVTVPLAPGDLFMLFTDGMSEMMNPEHDCFGETRLGEIAGDVEADFPQHLGANEIGAGGQRFEVAVGQLDQAGERGVLAVLRHVCGPLGSGLGVGP